MPRPKKTKLAFVVYESRSGSTFLTNRLSRYTDVVVFPESNFITNLLQILGNRKIIRSEKNGIIEKIFEDPKFADYNLNRSDLKDLISKSKSARVLIEKILELYAVRTKQNGSVYVFKKGSYANYLRELYEVFPDACYVGLYRDPRAVFLSKSKSVSSGTGKVMEGNPYLSALEWKIYDKNIENLQYFEKSIIISYEDLILFEKDSENSLTKFLNIDVRSLEKPKYIVPNRYGKLHSNISSPPIFTRLDAWQNELKPTEIFLIEQTLKRQMLSKGYERNEPKLSSFLTYALAFLYKYRTILLDRRRVLWKWYRYQKSKYFKYHVQKKV